MLVVMAGLPGTGKSTIARALATELDALVLDKDTIRAALFPMEYIEYSREQDDFCVDIMLELVEWHLRKQRIVILDGRTYTYAYQRQQVMETAKRISVPVQWILCTCNDALAQERLATDHANGTHPATNRTPELFMHVKARFEPFTLPHLYLDTDQCVGSCIQQCQIWLKAGDHGPA